MLRNKDYRLFSFCTTVNVIHTKRRETKKKNKEKNTQNKTNNARQQFHLRGQKQQIQFAMKGDDRDDTSEPTLYAPLKKNNNESDFSDITISPTPPKDTNNLVYLSLLSCGIGFILPYSSFIVAADYWQERFQGNSVAIDMSLTYILTACCTAFANSLTISIIPFKWRITLGYTISFIILVFITVCEVAFHIFSKTTAYSVCLLAVLAVSFGSTVQQSSFYGFSSAFPNKYTQALMAGESVAGEIFFGNCSFLPEFYHEGHL